MKVLSTGQTLQETATLLDMTVGAVEHQVHNACNRLFAKDSDALVYLCWLAGMLPEL
ncbi:hypothetical protein H8S90_09095 [Olivibacter sp. SDN3]|uniref:hypothetical protein n=1 Tax=Olivibacter sp. SDN3 TaxID=2764720 RepID=UPI001650FC3A|nr:hypothetical protein [Olivibacter sp. SDN3]QNL51707.1 hypothetical protein H8S90_09095 [Olivibacter sp. SDN3]